MIRVSRHEDININLLMLAQVLKAEPFLELSSGQSSHHYQLFVTKNPDIELPTVQDLFDQSFVDSGVKLRRTPPVLILQMPRFARSISDNYLTCFSPGLVDSSRSTTGFFHPSYWT